MFMHAPFTDPLLASNFWPENFWLFVFLYLGGCAAVSAFSFWMTALLEGAQSLVFTGMLLGILGGCAINCALIPVGAAVGAIVGCVVNLIVWAINR